MGRRWMDSAVEGAEALLHQDLAAAERRARELIRQAKDPQKGDPRGVIRAQALLMMIYAERGQLDAAICLYLETREGARQRGRMSPAALAELDLKAAYVYCHAGQAAEARRLLLQSRTVLNREIERASTNTSQGGKLRWRILQQHYATSWITSSRLALNEGDFEQAYQDALKAAELCEKERLQSAALRLLSLAAAHRPKSLPAALRLLLEAEKRLLKRRTTPQLTLNQFRWTRALTLECAGLMTEAEELISGVCDWFRASPYQEDARRSEANRLRIRQKAAEDEKTRQAT